MKMTQVKNLEPGDRVQGIGLVIHPPAREQGCLQVTYLLNDGGVEKRLYLKDKMSEPVDGSDIEAVNRHLRPMPLWERYARVQVSDAEEDRRRKKAMADRGRALARKASKESAAMRRNRMQKGSNKD